MAKKNAEQFIEMVNNDKELQEKLAQKGKEYQGDSSDLEAVVRQSILPVAGEMGLAFTAAEYLECVREQAGRKSVPKSGKMSEDDLDLVVGGVSGDVNMQGNVGGDMVVVDQSVNIQQNYYFVFPGASSDAMNELFG